MKTVKLASVLAVLAVFFFPGMVFAQTDPGVQGGNRGSGAALPSVLANDNPGILAFFSDGLKRFQDVESVSNSPTGNNGWAHGLTRINAVPVTRNLRSAGRGLR